MSNYIRTKGGPIDTNRGYVEHYKRMVKVARILSGGLKQDKVIIKSSDYNDDDLGLIADILSVNGYAFRYDNIGLPSESIIFTKQE